MIKKNKLRLIISSAVILLPMLLTLVAHNLPERIVIHWGFNGAPDGYGDPTLVFIVMPLIMLAIHWTCMLIWFKLDKNSSQNPKITNMMFWILPAISLCSCGVIFSASLGYTASVFLAIYLVLGIAFILIGNYMPKTTRNRTTGIKIKWTMANDENWQATHRFAGKVYVITGFMCFAAMLLPEKAFPVVAFVMIIASSVLPVVYSYAFYKKQLSDGRATKEDYETGYVQLIKNKKAAVAVTVAITAVLGALFGFIMFTGDIHVALSEDSLTVDASFSGDITVRYEDIDAVEYRAEGVDGKRMYGFASARLLIGTFSNEEFGAYSRYTYTGDGPCVVLTLDGERIVIGLKNEEELHRIYERVSQEIIQLSAE